MTHPQHSAPTSILSSAPGRICLFGEHQDYLRLPVIAMAIDLRIELRGEKRRDSLFRLVMPDIEEERVLDGSFPLSYESDHDYLAAALNVLRREGVSWPSGYDVTIRSSIPINSGASSSSALQVAWIAFLLAAGNDNRQHQDNYIAEMAYASEVTEFGAPGGMMDHYSSALGNLIYLDCRAPVSVELLPKFDASFILIDSGEPKQTNMTLGRVRRPVERAFELLDIPLAELFDALAKNGSEDFRIPDEPELEKLVNATAENYRLTQQARRLLCKDPVDVAEIGVLLSTHHRQLSRVLEISTPTIDCLLENSSRLGAMGGKINGSGGGGSCFALCPDCADQVASEIRNAGYRCFVVHAGQGVTVSTQ